jgi:hypothetical protein
MSREVTRPFASASRRSAMDASTIEKGVGWASTGAGTRTIATPSITAATIKGSRTMGRNIT